MMFTLSPSERKGAWEARLGARGCTRGPAGDRLAMTGLLACGECCPEHARGPRGLPEVGEWEVGDW